MSETGGFFCRAHVAPAEADGNAVVSKKRKADDDAPVDQASKRQEVDTTGVVLWRLVETRDGHEPPTQEMTLHRAWPLRDALMNGIIACVCWMLRERITRESNWDGRDKDNVVEKSTEAEDDVVDKALREVRIAANPLWGGWYEKKGSRRALTSGAMEAIRKFRQDVSGVTDDTLCRWFDAMSNTKDGISVQYDRRFDVLREPPVLANANYEDDHAATMH